VFGVSLLISQKYRRHLMLFSFPRSDETTSHSTQWAKNAHQAAGYPWECIRGRSASHTAERHGRRSHAEHGNDAMPPKLLAAV